MEMEKVIEKLDAGEELELYSANAAPWVNGGAWVRVSKTSKGYKTLFWLAGDGYGGKPAKVMHNTIESLEQYLSRYSFTQ